MSNFCTVIDALLDERDERAGIKLKDADLIGLPLQVIIGEKNIKGDKLEIKERVSGKVTLVRREEALVRLEEII